MIILFRKIISSRVVLIYFSFFFLFLLHGVYNCRILIGETSSYREYLV